MKLQGLAIIFVIIMLPIVIITSGYIQTQIDTVVLQTKYDTILMNATYDAIKAFQINETNSTTQNIPTEKIRDIKASIATFYNSLGTGMGASGYTEEDLKPYVPVLVYTLYDGYYIYAPFYNTNTNKKDQGLKPYIYYSARYVSGNNDITINYTLDNYITVYGMLNGKYETRSGYLINPADWNSASHTYKGITISDEYLTEIDDATCMADSHQEIPYKYIAGENKSREKAYYRNGSWYRYTIDKKVLPIKDPASMGITSAQDSSAILYYEDAAKFSNWVITNLGGLTVGNIQMDSTLKSKLYGSNSGQKIFDISSHDPESKVSNFYTHKRDIIRNSIQTNLYSAIAAYNDSTSKTYNFKMPELTDNDWDRILNNVSMISFLQGLPIKNKYYMGYSVMTNNKNREFVDPESIYLINGDTYHSVTHKGISGGLIGYRNIDFDEKVVITNQNQTLYYYPHGQLADYDCLVSNNSSSTTTKEEALKDTNIAKAYYTALARERYNSYKSNRF